MYRVTNFFIVLVGLGLLSMAPVQAQFSNWTDVPSDYEANVGPTPLLPVGDATRAMTFFGDRATFDAAAPGAVLEDFSGTLVAPNSVCADLPPLSALTNDACFPAGGVIPGFELDVSAGDYVILTTGFLGVPFNVVGANTFTVDTILRFDPPVTALGFDLVGDVMTPVNVNIDIYGAGGVLLGSTAATGSIGGTFWGVVSTDPIAWIEMVEPQGGGELIGNLAFGAATTVPTMSSYGLAALIALLGIVGLIAIIRRR